MILIAMMFCLKQENIIVLTCLYYFYRNIIIYKSIIHYITGVNYMNMFSSKDFVKLKSHFLL